MMSAPPSVLVFDVNETLLDIESMAPLFDKIFGDPGVLREWFNQLVLYSMASTLSDHYADFFTLARAVLQMVADVRGVGLTDANREAIKAGMRSMPAHPDVEDGLKRLSDSGFQLETLTNSPPGQDGVTAADRAGLSRFFDRQFSVHASRAFKPATRLYRDVARELGAEPSSCMMVAAHPWDLIGAQSVGYSTALITRPGNAPLRVHGLPEPTLVAPDLRDLADQLARA
jgi:2-haloacid dehalogenase